jgi:hypothetical protein
VLQSQEQVVVVVALQILVLEVIFQEVQVDQAVVVQVV